MAADAPSILDDLTAKAPPGTILPPRSQRNIVEKTAGYIARNGAAFEERLRSDKRLTFLDPADAYHAYYQWRLAEIKAGR
ncbi:SF3a splicing factor complex subunit, partial [Teratosphaeriaceae sp. CCFEE 6253]